MNANWEITLLEGETEKTSHCRKEEEWRMDCWKRWQTNRGARNFKRVPYFLGCKECNDHTNKSFIDNDDDNNTNISSNNKNNHNNNNYNNSKQQQQRKQQQQQQLPHTLNNSNYETHVVYPTHLK